ncbi:flagellar FliJ protein [Cryobacterium flavum]|uniref:Flagellar FliJ protein n=1 Tax=Cryobacterium flavum TaxID=1424659 RepID=A0A4R8UVL3_9MICO|nr:MULTISPECIES: flagellar FliJ family protein [Cryobacterium]TFB73030.1 flagellar export protein FliJ [Cryobacterium flavum]SDN02894.1 flagellar FliJ protein [Cryobacterium flavum]
MSRLFPLAGLLRLRKLQQNQAALDLAEANARVAALQARRGRARSALGALGNTPQTIAALNAMAAARSSSRSMLAELDAMGRNHQETLDSAQSNYNAARAESVALEKLHDRHAAAVLAEDLHAEQTVLDEIAGARWHRSRSASLNKGETP